MKTIIFTFLVLFAVNKHLIAHNQNTSFQKAILFLNSDLDSAKYYTEQALKTAKKNNDFILELESLILKQKITLIYGNPDSANIITKKLFSLLNTCNNDSIKQLYEAKITSMEGSRYMDAGKYQEADSCFRLTIQLAKRYNYPDIIMTARLNLGMVDRALGNLSNAFENYHEALILSDSIKNCDIKFSILNLMGQLLVDVGEPDEGLKYLEQAKIIKDSVHYIGYVAEWKAHLGYAWYNKNNLQKAESYYLQSLDLAIEHGMLFYEALALTNLGEINLDKGDLAHALSYLNRGLALFDQLQSMYGRFYTISLLGGYYHQTGQFSQAETFFREAEKMITQIEVIAELKKRHYQRKYNLYKTIGKAKEALEAFELFKEAENIIKNKEVKWKVEKLERSIQLAEKETMIHQQQVELEQKKHRLQSYKNQVLLILLTTLVIGSILSLIIHSLSLKRKNEKKLFKSELDKLISNYKLKSIQSQISPHFIFNALNSLWSIIKHKDEQLGYEVIIRLSKLLRNTLDHSELSLITLQEEIDFVKNYLELERICFDDKFSYSIEFDNNINTELPIIPRCIQTHVENALKHGIKPKPSKGFLKITLKNNEYYTLVIIEDNGIGRKAATNNSPLSTGLGLKIQHQIISLYNTNNPEKISLNIIDLEDSRALPTGTRIEIKIPHNYSYILN